MHDAVSLREAARTLRVHPSTLRDWIANGCPCVSLGYVGRGKGSLVDVEAVRAWRATQLVPGFAERSQADVLAVAKNALLDALKRDDLARQTGLTEGEAAFVVLKIYERFYRNIKSEPLTVDALPEEMKCLSAIYLDSAEHGASHRRSHSD